MVLATKQTPSSATFRNLVLDSRARIVLGGSSLSLGVGLFVFSRRQSLRRLLLRIMTIDSFSFILVIMGLVGLGPVLMPMPQIVNEKRKPIGAKTKPKLSFLDVACEYEAELEEFTKEIGNLGHPNDWQFIGPELQERLKNHKESEKQAIAKRRDMICEELSRRMNHDMNNSVPHQMIVRKMQPHLFVLEFSDEGKHDIYVSLERLRLQINFVISVAYPQCDEVLLILRSSGGPVSEYGLASAQLMRLRSAGIKITVAIDTVAASGGYMMACVAHEIIAASFAFVGSIGVVAELPNVHKLLDKAEIEYLLVTAGKFKRTVHTLVENTSEGIEQFRQELEDIHNAFKQHVQTFRSVETHGLNIGQVATGESWLAVEGLKHGLVDRLMTSDEFIQQKLQLPSHKLDDINFPISSEDSARPYTDMYRVIRVGSRKESTSQRRRLLEWFFSSASQYFALPLGGSAQASRLLCESELHMKDPILRSRL